jgi:hypothetical protein
MTIAIRTTLLSGWSSDCICKNMWRKIALLSLSSGVTTGPFGELKSTWTKFYTPNFHSHAVNAADGSVNEHHMI